MSDMDEPLRVIATADMRLGDVPPVDASYDVISRFALTFDPREAKSFESLNSRTLPLSADLQQLRYHLYVEQRRWNHRCQFPDARTVIYIKDVLMRIREMLAEK